MPDADLVALRNALAAVCAEAKAVFPSRDHAVIDRIAATLNTIPGDLIPDYKSLDRHGAGTKLLAEDAHHLAEFNRPTVADAGALVRALMMFTDKLRPDEIEWLARQNRYTLDRKPIYNA